jgi:hypothetical protein
LIIENLTEENFLLQSAKHYKNKQCQNTEEFLSDLKHIKYIKKLNHIIILNNVFGPIFLSRLIFLKFYTQLFYLKPFLLYLNLLPDVVNGVNGLDYNTVAIEMDWNIIEKLREINNNAYKN